MAFGLNQCYFTNDHAYANGLMRSIEDCGRLMANLIYHDGSSYNEAAAGFSYANGVNASPDGEKLYLTATTERILHVFKRDIPLGSFDLVTDIELGIGGDNIEIDAKGEIWIGAHPQLLKFVSHAADRSKLSPSQVPCIKQNWPGDYAVEEIYLNDGQALSGSSVAAVMGNRLLIGAVLEHRFLDCSM